MQKNAGGVRARSRPAQPARQLQQMHDSTIPYGGLSRGSPPPMDQRRVPSAERCAHRQSSGEHGHGELLHAHRRPHLALSRANEWLPWRRGLLEHAGDQSTRRWATWPWLPANWPRLAVAGGRPELALAPAGRAGGRSGRSLWAAAFHIGFHRRSHQSYLL
eukprot:scaffold98800_cov54-Phaeocystis_antarctica.AAC.4